MRWLTPLLRSVIRGPERPPAERTRTPKRQTFRPRIEQLEDRTVLSNFTASSAAELIADINAANATGGPNTITLVAGASFKLNAANNFTYCANELPVIASGDKLTII